MKIVNLTPVEFFENDFPRSFVWQIATGMNHADFSSKGTSVREVIAFMFLYDLFSGGLLSTEVESWRNIQSSKIEFTMKRLREPKTTT